MCRQAIATGSSWNETWIWRCTYSLGMSGYGQRSLSRNSCAMPGWSSAGRSSSHVPAHQSRNCPTPSVHALSIAAMVRDEPVRVELHQQEVQVGEPLEHPAAHERNDDSLRNHRRHHGMRSQPIDDQLVVQLLVVLRASGRHHALERRAAASWFTFTPPVATWKATSIPFACAAAHTRSSARDVYGIGRHRGQDDRARAERGDALDLGDGIVEIAHRDRRRREDPVPIGSEHFQHDSRCRHGRARSRARGGRGCRARRVRGSGAATSPGCPRGRGPRRSARGHRSAGMPSWWRYRM